MQKFDSGAGGGAAVTAGEFLLTGAVVINGSFSIDVFPDQCDEEGTDFSAITTRTGTYTLTLTNISSTTGNLFPSGVILQSYTVKFIGQSAGAPGLPIKSYGVTGNVVNGASISTNVVIADLATIIPDYAKKVPSGTIHSYVVQVSMKGTTLAGDNFTVTASMLVEMGNFDGCSDS